MQRVRDLPAAEEPARPQRALRALLVALDEWVAKGREPPAAGAAALGRDAGSFAPQKRVGFPSIPGVTYNGLMTTGDLFDFGPALTRAS